MRSTAHEFLRKEKKMKILFKKQVNKISEQLTAVMKVMLKSHGIKPKESDLMRMKESIKKCLGK